MKKQNDFRFLIIGLGSMGRRRIRNLLSLGYKVSSIMGYDISVEKCLQCKQEYNIETISSLEKVFDQKRISHIIICTPPDSHAEYFKFANSKTVHFFSEISTVSDGYKDLLKKFNQNIVGAPSCTFRFYEPIKTIKNIISKNSLGNPLCFNLYLGQYLPDWHWWEDYKKVYFAKKRSGGCREMLLYDLNWLCFIFDTELKNINGIRRKISELEIEADDIYLCTVEFSNGIVGNIMIDLLNRKPERSFKMIASKGTLSWNWLENEMLVFKKGIQTKKRLSPPLRVKKHLADERMYKNELNSFIQNSKGKGVYPYSFEEDFHLLKTVEKFTGK